MTKIIWKFQQSWRPSSGLCGWWWEVRNCWKTQFPTTTLIETLDKWLEFFSRFDNLAGLAVGSFLTNWYLTKLKHISFITINSSYIGECGCRWCPSSCLNVPIYLPTDVNSSAFGEVSLATMLVRIENLVYYTIGTGIELERFNVENLSVVLVTETGSLCS